LNPSWDRQACKGDRGIEAGDLWIGFGLEEKANPKNHFDDVPRHPIEDCDRIPRVTKERRWKINERKQVHLTAAHLRSDRNGFAPGILTGLRAAEAMSAALA
jgi:hypothetical protein